MRWSAASMMAAHKTPGNKCVMFTVEPIWCVCFIEMFLVVPHQHLKPFFSLFLVDYLWDGHQSSPAEALLPNGLSSCKQEQQPDPRQMLHSSFVYKIHSSWSQRMAGVICETLGLPRFGQNSVRFEFLGFLWLLITLWDVAYIKARGNHKKANAAPQAFRTQHKSLCVAPQGSMASAKTSKNEFERVGNPTLNISRNWWQRAKKWKAL